MNLREEIAINNQAAEAFNQRLKAFHESLQSIHPEAELRNVQDDAAEEIRQLQSFDAMDEFAPLFCGVLIFVLVAATVAIVAVAWTR